MAKTTLAGEIVQSHPMKTRREASTWIEAKHIDAKFGDEGERIMSAAIIKGLIEHGDRTRFFGSTMSFNYHLNNAVERGFLLADGSLTACARDWYDRNLQQLPQSRQVFWDRKLIGIPAIDPAPSPMCDRSGAPDL